MQSTSTLATKNICRVLSVYAFIVIVSHVIASFSPTPFNWGFHHLAFFSTQPAVLIPILMLFLLLRSFQQFILNTIEDILKLFSHIPKFILLSLLGVGSGILFWVMRVQSYFLGDGYFIIRSLVNIQQIRDIPPIFTNEPLPGLIEWKFYKLLSFLRIADANTVAVQILSVLLGVGCIIIFLLFAKHAYKESIDRFLFVCLLLAAGGSQLFFGYVENYTLLYFLTSLYMYFAYLNLKGKAHLLVPSVTYGLMFVTHFGMIVLLPSLCYLFLKTIRLGSFKQVIFPILATLSTATLTLFLCGYTYETFVDVFGKSGSHLLPIVESGSSSMQNSIFSLPHFLDFLNLQMLLSPFGLMFIFVILFLDIRKILFGTSIGIFLAIAAVGGIIFSYSMNFILGLSRDWDLNAAYGLGIIFLLPYSMTYVFSQDILRRSIMIMFIGITLLHTGTSVCVNANETRALERFKLLPNSRSWSPNAQAVAYDELGGFYRDKKNYTESIAYYHRALQIDSTNGRLWMGIGYTYSLLNRYNDAIYYCEKAIYHSPENSEYYANLGAIYERTKRFDDAIRVTKKAVSLNPRFTIAWNNLGLLYLNGKKVPGEALPYFQHAIQLDSTYANAYLNAGICLNYLQRYNEMKSYLEKFLNLDPDSPFSSDIRKMFRTR